MPGPLQSLSRFWQELKRRNVVRRNTVYAATAFVILELISIIQEPLMLPEWTLSVVIIFLSIGFILSIVISWIYDVNPDGVLKKTKPVKKATEDEKLPASSSWKIASYISFAIILVLVILNIIPRSKLWESNNLPDRSIAVIPFMNDSPEEEKMYFINGTMEEILDNLSRIEDLKVISRTTVEQYRENRKTVPVIAEELNVGYVLEGSGQRDGNQVRITVQLLDKSDRHIWTESYVREIENIFDLQKEVARLVAREVERAIGEVVINKSRELSDNSQLAQAFFDKGQEIMNQYWKDIYNLGLLQTAEVLFRFALEYDSTHSQAYMQLANAYNMRYWRTSAKEEALDSALLMVNKAIQNDPQNSGLHSFKGSVLTRRGQPDEALAAYEMAVSIDPKEQQSQLSILEYYRNKRDYIKALETYKKYFVKGSESAVAQKRLSGVMENNGFKDVGQQLVENAFQLDGDTADYYYRLGRIELILGNLKSAIEFFIKAETVNPENYLQWLAISYYWDRQYEQSLLYYKKHIERIGPDLPPFFRMWAGYVFIQKGETSQGERYIQMDFEWIQQNLEAGINLRGSKRDMAEILAFRGEKQEALNHLRDFVNQEGITEFELNFLNSPMFDSLRDEPEFLEILKEGTAKAQVYHDEIGQWLEENDVL